jgi:hypothetical protein
MSHQFALARFVFPLLVASLMIALMGCQGDAGPDLAPEEPADLAPGEADLGAEPPDLAPGADLALGPDLAASPEPDLAAAPDGAAADAGPVTFSGSSAITHVTESGEVRRPDDARPGIAALLPDGHGGYTTLPASTSLDGTFMIPGIPPGVAFWLRHGADHFIWTSARSIDLGRYQLGRPDRVAATTSPTRLSIGITGASPWQHADDIELTVANLGLVLSPLAYSTAVPEAGDTVMLASLDWTELVRPWLIDGTRGDVAYLTQLVARSAPGGIPYLALDRAATLAPFTQVNGAGLLLMTALTGTAPLESVTLRWQRSQFAVHKAAVHPGAEEAVQSLRVGAQPGGLSRGEIGDAPTLLLVEPPIGAGDLDLGTLAYRNPFPASFGVYGRATHVYRVSFPVPGAANAVLFAGIGVARSGADLSAGPLVPAISPVQNLTLNGRSARSAITGATPTPTLRWDPPAVGVPTGTLVILYEIRVPPGQRYPRITRVATLYTREASVAIPPGLLQPGGSYCFLVRVLSQPGADLTARPYHTPLPEAFADTVSALVSP